jgi:hypothetical protein
MDPCPNKIDGAEVLAWAALDDTTSPTGNSTHIVRGTAMQPASGLAICRYDHDQGFYLFYCDSAWCPQTDTYHDTMDDAKAQASFEYNNLQTRWNVSA